MEPSRFQQLKAALNTPLEVKRCRCACHQLRLKPSRSLVDKSKTAQTAKQPQNMQEPNTPGCIAFAFISNIFLHFFAKSSANIPNIAVSTQCVQQFRPLYSNSSSKTSEMRKQRMRGTYMCKLLENKKTDNYNMAAVLFEVGGEFI